MCGYNLGRDGGRPIRPNDRPAALPRFAAARRRTRTTCAWPRCGRWAARSATNSWCRSAAATTARRTGSADERGWWKAAGVDPLVVARKLWWHSRLIAQAEPALVQAPSKPLHRAAGPRPGTTPSPQNPTRQPAGALSGDRKGQHSIRINDQWRVCFFWRSGDAYDVEIVDYH